MNSSPGLPEGLVIPDHQLERRIGQGGYGEIWLARNAIGTYRAVKVVYRSRFDNAKPYEREFNGLKAFEPVSRNHPGFVDVLQVGRNDQSGCIYYVMELADDEVSGRVIDPDTYSAKTLSRVLQARGRLPADECLRIGMSLASALGHLHDAGLVHRDIKPSNIIFVNDQPKLADIGLVVSLSDARTFVGSDGYIPPEGPGTFQADVYSLGKLLYEISTGQDKEQFPALPRDIATFQDATTVMELNEVVLRACENDLAKRYKTADELRADLEVLFAGHSVKQRHLFERQLGHVRRVAKVAVVCAVAAAIIAGGIARVRHKEIQLLAKSYVTSGVQLFEDANTHAAVPLLTAALRLQQRDPAAVDSHRVRIGAALERAPRLLQTWEHGSPALGVRFSLDGERVLVAGGKAARIHDVGTGHQLREFPAQHKIYGASFSPDETRVAIANGKFITVFDATTGEQVYERKQADLVISAEFSPDGQKIVLGCSRGCAHVLDAANGRPVAPDMREHREEVGYACFSPDGTQILTASRDGSARLWDARTYASVATLPHAQWVLEATFSPDGRRVATCSSDNTVFVWDISGKPYISARMEHRGGVQSVKFSPDGRWLASASLDHTARFWDVKTGKPITSAVNMHAPGYHVAISPEGRRVATAEQSGRVRVWDITETPPVNVGPAIVSANNERYVTYTSNSFQIWNARDDSALTSAVDVPQPISSLYCNTDASTVLAFGVPKKDRSTIIQVYRSGASALSSFEITDSRRTALSPDGTKLLAATGTVAEVWETFTGKLLFERSDFPERVRRAAFSPDGGTVAVSCDRMVFVLDAANGKERFKPFSNAIPVQSIAFTRGGNWLACTTAEGGFTPGVATVRDAHTGVLISEFRRHVDGVNAAVLTGDGQYAATAGEDGFAYVWDPANGQPQFEPFSLSAAIKSLRFSSDDRWVSACSWREAQIWEVSTGRALTPRYPLPGGGRFDDCGIVAGERRFWVLSSRGLLFWELPRAEGDVDELTALASQLGATIPVGIQAGTYPLAQLQARCAIEQKRTQATLASWHALQARICEQEQDWFGARFHLERLLQSSPNDVALRARADAAAEHIKEQATPNEAAPSATTTP
jgi:WD40 repeat protein